MLGSLMSSSPRSEVRSDEPTILALPAPTASVRSFSEYGNSVVCPRVRTTGLQLLSLPYFSTSSDTPSGASLTDDGGI